jgi:antitoxin (DNA-binding transcriptional repressor) of toxin-antitoxin stability system
MASPLTLGATEFKAKCLEILDRIGRRELEKVVITKRGVAVGVLVPPTAEATEVARLPGFLRGSVIIPPRSIRPRPSPMNPLLPIKARSTGEPQRVAARRAARHLCDHLACQR